MTNSFFLSFILLFLQVMSELPESNTVSLKGVVIEAASGSPIPGATIQIEGLNQGKASNAEGEFEFPDLAEGKYIITVRSVEFLTKTIEVQHPEDGDLTVQMETKIIQSDDVIVTTLPLGRNLQYQPAQVLNLGTLQKKAAPSLGEILDGNPGVSTRSFGSAPARPVIRGMDGDRVLVMQNGERMGDLSGTAVDHAVALDPLSMDRVEVVRGPASLLYGSSAIGGVVNMFSNDMPAGWDKGTGGSAATHLAAVNNMGAGLLRVQHGTDSMAATGRIIYRDGGDLKTPEGRLHDTAIHNVSYGGGIGYRQGIFETGVSASGMDYIYGLPEAADNPDESVEIRMNRKNIQAISTIDFGRFIELAEIRIHYSDYHHDEFGITRGEQGKIAEESLDISFDQKTLSSSLVFKHQPVGKSKGAAGVSINYSQIAVGGKEALTPDADGYFIAGYLFEEIALSNYLTLKAGGRLEFKRMFVNTNKLFPDNRQFENRSDLILSGAFGLNYSPTPEWTAGVQIARAYRTPTVEELYSFAPHTAAGSFDIGDPRLDNEISIGTDAFIEYTSEKFNSQMSLFVNRIDSYVDFAPTGEYHTPSGLPFYKYGSKDALLYGFEFSADVDLSDKWTTSVVFDYVRGRERTGSKNNLAFIPPFRSLISLMYDNNTYWLGSRLRLIDSQQKVAPNEKPTEGYLLAGADAGYRFGNGIALSLRVDNIFNKKYRDHLSRVENRQAPMPGRNLNAMLRWDF